MERVKSPGRTEQNINRRLSSYLRDKVCPAPGERAVPQRHSMATRSQYFEIVITAYLERDIKHIRSGFGQLHVDFKTPVLDGALHDNLRDVNPSLARMQFNLLTA